MTVDVPWEKRVGREPLTALQALVTMIDSVETKLWVTSILGINCLESAQHCYSWFKPGDYISPHTDQV